MLKPIERPMKEYLNKLEDGTYKLVLLDSVADGVEGLIEVPDGGNFYCDKYFWKQVNSRKFWNGENWQDDERTLCNFSKSSDLPIVWKRSTIPEALPFIDDEPKYDHEDIGIAKDYDLDELAKEYKLRDRCDGETDEEYRYMLKHCTDLENYIAKETLNDKVASAEVARQEFIGVPFSDLPESNFEAVDEFVESNVEQCVKHPHYKKDISHLDILDIYRVTELFNPHSCGAHIAKKALCSGQRGHKDLLTDIQDIIDTAERWKEMMIEDETSCKD